MRIIKLSIIIPIYGVEDYISNFLKSLLPQLNKEVECIFVNDGTKDKSFEILKKYLAKYPNNNYQLLEQENQGLSMARNNGMKLVKGDYFGFIDSDDEVEPNYIKEILSIINHNEFDIMHFNATRIKNNKKTPIILANEPGLHNITAQYKIKIYTKWYAWLRVFNKKYLNVLEFPKNKTYEDVLAIPECYEFAKRIYELPVNLIKYNHRTTSISNNKKYNKINYESVLYGINKYKEKSHRHELYITYNFLINCARNFAVQLCFNVYKDFITNHQQDILKQLDINNNLSHKKKFFMKHPYIFYFVKKIIQF